MEPIRIFVIDDEPIIWRCCAAMWGVRGGGVNSLRGQNNVQGACDMEGLPNVMTGYQSVVDPKVREKFSRAWGKTLSERPGLTITI